MWVNQFPRILAVFFCLLVCNLTHVSVEVVLSSRPSPSKKTRPGRRVSFRSLAGRVGEASLFLVEQGGGAGQTGVLFSPFEMGIGGQVHVAQSCSKRENHRYFFCWKKTVVGWCLKLPEVLAACVWCDLRVVVQFTVVLPTARRVGPNNLWFVFYLVVVMSMSYRCRFVVLTAYFFYVFFLLSRLVLCSCWFSPPFLFSLFFPFFCFVSEACVRHSCPLPALPLPLKNSETSNNITPRFFFPFRRPSSDHSPGVDVGASYSRCTFTIRKRAFSRWACGTRGRKEPSPCP